MTSPLPEASDRPAASEARDRRRLPLAVLVVLLTAASIGLVGWSLTTDDGDRGAATTTGASATEESATTTTAAPAADQRTTTTPAPLADDRSPTTTRTADATAGRATASRVPAMPVTLPAPEDAPADPYAPTPKVVHGTLALPTIGVSQPLHEGVTLTAINHGPSHWPGTAMPGRKGNVVVAGHRTTYTRPFHDLDLLRVGDPLVFTMNDGTVWTYELVATSIVGPDAMHILTQTSEYTATLFACHPKGSAAQRIVTHFRLVDPAGG
jgi:sortase A